VLDDFVTRASGRFEPLRVENIDIAPAVADQFASLQISGGDGNGGSQYAQNVAQVLLRIKTVIRSGAIACHQEPAGETGIGLVKAVTCSDLYELNCPIVDVPVRLSVQGSRLRIFAAELRGCHA
jgi:hypothetical protein